MEVVEMSVYGDEFVVRFDQEDLSMARFSWATVRAGRHGNALRVGRSLLTDTDEARAQRIVRLAHRRPVFLASAMFFMKQEYHFRKKLMTKWERVIDKHYTATYVLDAGVDENQKVMAVIGRAARLANNINYIGIMKVKKLGYRKDLMAHLLLDSKKAIIRLRRKQNKEERRHGVGGQSSNTGRRLPRTRTRRC